MGLDKKEVLELAKLARLALTDTQISSLRVELDSILTLFESLAQIRLAGAESLSSLPAGEYKGALRADIVGESLTANVLGAMAPRWEDDMFVVPKVVSKDR